MKRLLGKTTLVVTFFLLLSCSEEIGPCHDMEVRCNELKSLMDKSTGAEKEQYRQYYLTEKHILENCLATHD
jgi:hypothetical protein